MERKNLASGKEVKITNLVPITNSYATVEKGRKDILTNGVIGDPSSCYNGEWVHFYRGMGRSLTVDLGEIFAVNGFSIGFIHDNKMGIYSPENVRFYLSEDGNEYYEMAVVEAPYPASFDMQTRAEYKADLEKTYRARYARIDFEVEVNVFCDELRIFGGDADGFEYKPSGKQPVNVNKDSFADRDTLDGVHDIPLLYWGYYPEDERVARLRKEDYLPFIAYIDRDGNVLDTMFDGLMFLNVQGRCPSGGSLGYHGPRSVLSDWEFLLDEMFLDGFNLKALDEAVADLKEKLGMDSDYKLKFYLTAPVPKISTEPFGDMNGDGIEEKILSTQDCIDAYAWYVDQVTRRYEAQHFENIVLDGWFWNNESASRASRDDEEVFAKGCMDELHKRGYKCIFIPYFQAGGCEKVDRIGFDVTTMQPGLSFQEVLGREPQGMMQDFTDLCKKYGFGVELEIHHGVKNQETKRKYGRLFDEYLIGCIRNGMMTDTLHTYYQAAGPGVFHFCAHSKDDYQRAVYDKLYKFIKGTLTEDDVNAEIPDNIVVPEQTAEEVPETIEEVAEETSEATVEVTSDETVAETVDEIVEAVEEAPKSVKDKVLELIEKITANVKIDEKKDEVVEEKAENESGETEENISEELTEEESKKRKFKCDKKDCTKALLIGAGVAAAIGIIYLLFKDKKDNE